MSKNRMIVILILLTAVLAQVYCYSNTNKKKNIKNKFIIKKATKEEALLLQEKYNSFKKEIVKVLSKAKSFAALENFLAEDFRFHNEFIINKNGEDLFFIYNNDEDILKEISKHISLTNLKYIFKTGVEGFSSDMQYGSIYAKDKLKNRDKYPIVTVVYYEENQKWLITGIRYTKISD